MTTKNQATPEGMGAMRKKIGEELDDAGLQTTGYIDKKGITAEQAMNPNTRFNQTPPGMYIEDQAYADIRSMEMKTITSMDYPGDGWQDTSDSIPGA